MTKKIKVIQVGLGQIGLDIARALIEHPDKFELVGCVDTAHEKIGKDLGDLIGHDSRLGVHVFGSIREAKRKADIAVHSTVSSLSEGARQISELLKTGVNVITTAEELFFLKQRDAKVFNSLDKLAKEKKVRLLATGVDPGFVMDSLVLMLTAPCTVVRSIRAERMIDLSKRRLNLQRKLGIGLSREEFVEESTAGKFGTVGLTDSAEFIVHHLGIEHDSIKSSVTPITADHDFHGENIFVARNHVIGVRHEVFVENAGAQVVSLRLGMRIDASIEYDSVTVDGEPPVNVIINNGIMGDRGTVGLILNQIGALLDSPPGYHDMAELPVPHFSLGRTS